MDFSIYFFAANDQIDFGERYQFILDLARYIDQRGYRAIWTPERHFTQFGGSFPNPAVLSAALAMVTRNIELRAGSVVVPHYHPARIVEDWSLIDQLSRGRVALCLATGWHRGDFIFYPENYSRRRDYTFGHVQTIRDLWAGREVTFSGVDGQPVPVRTFPRPCRPEIPLWLVYSTNPELWIKAGEVGANVLALPDNMERLRVNIARYRESLRDHGFDPRSGVVTLGLHTYVGDDDAEVRRLVSEPVKQYLSTFMVQRKADANLQGESRQLSDDEREVLAQLAFEDMYEKRSLLGTIPKCAAMVQKLQEMGANEIACLVDFGLDFATVMRMLPKLDELRAMFPRDTASAAAAPAAAAPAAPSAPAGADDMAWYYDR